MTQHHLIIVCGVPGAGKSTLAQRTVERWGAVSFASEMFADRLGVAARTPAGDLTKEAIVQAYSAMAAAIADALATSKLVVAVGSFRALEQRKRFREIAATAGARATTVRVVAPIATAAARVRSRIALGERGPTEDIIRQIDSELSRASDVDTVVTNETSIEDFHRQVDGMIESIRASN